MRMCMPTKGCSLKGRGCCIEWITPKLQEEVQYLLVHVQVVGVLVAAQQVVRMCWRMCGLGACVLVSDGVLDGEGWLLSLKQYT